jgi:hypothetical protein
MKYWHIKIGTLVGIIFFAFFLGIFTILLLFSHHGDTADHFRKPQIKA